MEARKFAAVSVNPNLDRLTCAGGWRTGLEWVEGWIYGLTREVLIHPRSKSRFKQLSLKVA